ncbi:MAG: WYL domain-containing protein, partial [Actinomycetia bacterium]|nr:WYL domain-containing protein [Actinomycetes bacterium]
MDKLSVEFKLSKKKLRKLLETISLCGVPDYTPYDLIDVDIEDEKVYLRYADFLSKPVNLSISEAIAILLSINLLIKAKAMQIDALVVIAEKIKKALTREAEREVEKASKSIDISITPEVNSIIWENINKCITSRIRALMKYHNIARDELTRRRIDPYRVIFTRGKWYLIGYCLNSKKIKRFRLDHIISFSPFKKGFDIKKYNYRELMEKAYIESGEDIEVRLKFDKEATRITQDKLGKWRFEDLPNGESIFKIKTSSYTWV